MENSTITQTINHVILKHCLGDLWDWTGNALEELKRLGITKYPQGRKSLNAQSLHHKRMQLRRGIVPCVLPAVFNGEPGPRIEKDKMYAELWRTTETFLEKMAYCGLVANQLDTIRNRLGPEARIVSCEVDETMYQKQKSLARFLNLDIELKKENIFSFLENTEEKFNILDLDLMTRLTSVRQLESWIKIIVKSTQEKSVVNLTTTIGRNTTEKKYNEIIEEIPELFESLNCKVVKHFRGKYRERMAPMRYEHLVLDKTPYWQNVMEE